MKMIKLLLISLHFLVLLILVLLVLLGKIKYTNDEEWMGRAMNGLHEEVSALNIYNSLLDEGFIVQSIGVKKRRLELRMRQEGGKDRIVVFRFKIGDRQIAHPVQVVQFTHEGVEELWTRPVNDL